MADVKISGLPAASTPVAGTEVLPIVQGGQTRQVSINNLTTGKAVTATQYTSTIAIGTAPLVVTSTTEVANLRAANATSADTANQIKSNATTGVLQVTGPTTASTRVMTTPDANFTAARTDAAQTFTGDQTFADVLATGYELLAGGILTESGTTRTLSATDNGKVIYCTSGSAVTINCAASLGAGFSCTIIQAGAGKVTVAANGQTLVSYSNLYSAMGQYAVISALCPVADTFLLAGNLGV